MCRLQNMALESVTDGQTDGQMDGQTTDKVIPMCRYASQATQQYYALKILYRESKIDIRVLMNYQPVFAYLIKKLLT